MKTDQTAFDLWLKEEKEQDEGVLDMMVDELVSSSDEAELTWGGS